MYFTSSLSIARIAVSSAHLPFLYPPVTIPFGVSNGTGKKLQVFMK